MPVDAETTATLHKLWTRVYSPTDSLTFPETVGALANLGVSRYRVDFVTSTTTAYIGPQADTYAFESHVSDLHPGIIPWAVEKLKAAIAGAQAAAAKGEGDYVEFCRKAVEGGVVEYTTYIDGKRVTYGGALGDAHTEWFPGAGPKKD